MSGKGSAPRPYSVKDDVFAERYCCTFGHKERAGRCINCGAKLESSPNIVGNENGEPESATAKDTG